MEKPTEHGTARNLNKVLSKLVLQNRQRMMKG